MKTKSRHMEFPITNCEGVIANLVHCLQNSFAPGPEGNVTRRNSIPGIHKQALCAVATRLANRIGKVLRTGEAYELRDTAGQPITVAEGRASLPSASASPRRSATPGVGTARTASPDGWHTRLGGCPAVLATRNVTEINAMPRGRKPQGDQALSNAERQARYRARRLIQPAIVTRTRRPSDRRSRPQRWQDAVSELLAHQAEYAAWYDALPDSLRDSPTAEALDAIVSLDLTDLADIALPRGYGRD